ncbi:hypothetical protein SELMODRAFT_84903 [Selaginella moellendorffii]|uniref:Oleosin n=1 Tax=Selaginella moellendorffii TaxID=88036 RepID=D8R4R5_SELML|nr:oleosin 1 [Selaginella moellendorffii]XP_002971607.1 oleosin 1 [Selaginella moellendorffii]EFJ27356.1 hypothetical protein SELMODRAFT_95913 [Selaginella moellendorffii]EFJ33148.1 hypothetical protein SELMODRAFT_84903 [Selaginella moellendorffii]|eukprot:XP_002965728.1 oleosin 1 [Selaginella moellendorffii]
MGDHHQASRAVDKTKDQAKDQAGRIQEHSRGLVERVKEHAPSSQQLIGIATLALGGLTLAAMGGAMILATIVFLVIGTPIFLLFSPILVPLGILAIVVTGGILSTIAFVASCVAAVTWIYKYAKGRHPVGTDQIEAARHRLMDTATQMTEKAREYGSNVTGYLQQKSQDVAPGA